MKTIFALLTILTSHFVLARPIPTQDIKCSDNDSTLEITIYEDKRSLDNNAYNLSVATPWLKEKKIEFVTSVLPTEKNTEKTALSKREVLVTRQEAFPIYVARNEKGQTVTIVTDGRGQSEGEFTAQVVLAVDGKIFTETLFCKAKRRF